MLHDLGWWGVVLAIIGLVVMIPASMVANFLTPTFVNWLLSRSKKSLDKRIIKLEQRLAELEKYPTISEAEDHILWGITTLKISISNLTATVFAVAYLGALVLVRSHTAEIAAFSPILLLLVASNTLIVLRLRYQRGFRYKRSPNVREGLRKSISELKDIQANWRG
jgi:hypothetical protein